ncbi:phosphoenolpyruvate--protein phosphotransferase [bacterium]|nr:MAG: phosphoenolpyruvate--protein phosphotransferase [bacterium]
MAQVIYKGIGSGDGFAIAPAVIVHRGELAIPQNTIDKEEIDHELTRFDDALNMTTKQLNRIKNSIAKSMGEDAASIIDAQIMVLADPACVDETKRIIQKKNINAEYAFDTVIQSSIEALRNSNNSTFVDRIQDFQDVRTRLLANLMGLKHQVIPAVENESILVINHLAPSETAHLFGSKYVGLVTEAGGFTSHIAIMSRTMDLPAVLGVENITENLTDNTTIIVDSMIGQVVIDPEEKVLKQYEKQRKLYAKKMEFFFEARDKPAVTKDNIKVTVSANMELPEEVLLAEHYGAEGIGLFRTELLYIQKEDLPTESEQFEVYKQIAKQISPHSAIIRTFDVGGDKFGNIFHQHYEPNPFLGFRAIRIGLMHPDILKTQLRAILRASHYGNLMIMFPMISLPEEMTLAREMVEKVKEELRAENQPFDENIQVGAMVEVPSAAILSRELARECDFFSIGTNDLIQYTLAADRGNPRVAHIYQTYQPSVLKLIKFAIDSAHFEGIWVGVCGEMAGEMQAVPMLLGMGLDEFSAVPARVPVIKKIIRSLDMKTARQIAEQTLRFTKHSEVISYLNDRLAEIIPEKYI